MKTCIVIGAGSDIYNGIKPMLEKDYNLVEFFGPRLNPVKFPTWDVMLITMGSVAPVGYWWDIKSDDFDTCVLSNLLKPMRMLKELWPFRAHDATVVWFSGSNPQGIMDGYAPYNTSKMAVNKLIEQLDHETPDAKFIAFGPGYVRDSKIHKATLEKGWNNPRIARGDAGTSLEAIHSAIQWCVIQSKQYVGGRNICVSDLPITTPMTPDRFKLRRTQ